MERWNIAGMSFGGGRKENFFFALLEFFPQKKRWFLAKLETVRGEEKITRDKAITSWVDHYQLKSMMVDFPLSGPACLNCSLDCPGADLCPRPEVVTARARIEELLAADEKIRDESPKDYERSRLSEQKVLRHGSFFEERSRKAILSRSFKRRFRKGFIPYWNRTLDVWVWENYYDDLLQIFGISYDSFGTVSLMLHNRLHYLMRHMPIGLTMYEVNSYLCLIEMVRAGILDRGVLLRLQDLEAGGGARLEIIHRIEKKLGLFIYERDLEALVQHPKAFDSFLLALAGQRLLLKDVRLLPSWPSVEETRFVVPQFGEKLVLDNNQAPRP